jgi:hypothetical protein
LRFAEDPAIFSEETDLADKAIQKTIIISRPVIKSIFAAFFIVKKNPKAL